MITHFIYHIPGRKVGCTNQIEDRMRVYEKDEGSRPIFEILEELHDATDQEAGDIEWQWADRFGYPRRNHYTTQGGFKTGIAGKAGAKRSLELTTHEQRSTWGQKGSKHFWDNLTPDRRLEFIQNRNTRRMEVTTPQQRSNASYTANKAITPEM